MGSTLHAYCEMKRERRQIKRKVRELFLYIIDQFQDRWWSSMEEADTVFHFIAFKSDMMAYFQYGRSITGASWIKGEKYPIPVYPAKKKAKDEQPRPCSSRAAKLASRLHSSCLGQCPTFAVLDDPLGSQAPSSRPE